MLELTDLAPEPREEWRRSLRFCNWDDASRMAALATVEPLLKRGHELVVGVYDYLSRVPETAEILGWERGVDPAHLEERRRFFTAWLTRTLSLDTSDEFADVLFRAGKYHAADGPRRIHTPEQYVTGSIGLVLGTFAAYLGEAGLPAGVIAPAMGAWSRYLSAQLNQMLLGYRVAVDMKRGATAVRCRIFGRLRPVVNVEQTIICVDQGAPAGELLRKFFSYYPQARGEALERVWHSSEPAGKAWIEVHSAYRPKYGWRVLLNGRDLEYAGGFGAPVHQNDEVSIFPPGR